jgi:hypothetical protein
VGKLQDKWTREGDEKEEHNFFLKEMEENSDH